ncbi:NAD(P)/FAD-dependent oxidoreductase [Streptomyces sp. NPDC057445]|uniref:NAD(P)/FAD-dependent oxidoreductase n=1 Tax=Streptomyces sp. NPDC057445 TaxID=3346136 RepID=UPI0036A3439E
MTVQNDGIPAAGSADGVDRYDVVVVGGGAAGLGGGLALARARRSVLVVDAGEPRNAPAEGVHNYPGREGTSPAELLADGRAEVTGYGGTVVAGRVVSARPLEQRPEGQEEGRAGFTVALADGTRVRARRLLVTSGLVDELPDVPGLAQRWGRDVLHCPYCHGWEVRDRTIGVLATGPHGVEQALLFRQWSEDVTLFLHTAPDPTEEQRERLAARGVVVVDGEVAGVEVTDDRLTGLRLRSGRVVGCEAVAVAPRFVARGEVLASLGLDTAELSNGTESFGSYVPAGPAGATEVPGVWVAGNATDLYAGAIQAAAAGVTAAAAINADLVGEDTDRAVAGFRARGAGAEGPFSARMEAAVAERVLGARRHGL